MGSLYVNVWEEKIIIPTYGVGKPEKNPMFFEKRVYQGSSGVVYPNPIIEKILDEKQDKEYVGLFLENKYLKIMILPEIGGRIQMAFDKIKKRHFIYYNQVIKPALVGLTGPWISGGIEFNWPQHHRPSTFEPVDYKIEENEDGSRTVWVNEIERMFHTKGMAGFTLYPDKAYIEIKVKLFNRSTLPQTFLWWANPAVKVNDDYQSVFPPDVNAVYDHGKRDVSTFPIATGTYYKVDYSPGTDISMYKNIPVPTSYMAINSDYDFIGGYEHDTRAGLLHVANHFVSPGKKQWTWGHSDFGKAWDRNLTDEDGPYIELMTGVFTDNQPDFSWIMPYETKCFKQYFLPYRELGVVKNATKDILISVNVNKNKIQLKIFATSVQKNIKVNLSYNGILLFNKVINISPEEIFMEEIDGDELIDEQKILLLLNATSGRELIRYEPARNRKNEIPQPAKPAQLPGEISSNEQLFLTGQHLEQYRHTTYHAVPYYEEALRRDPSDIRNNNALGKWYLRRGQFAIGEPYFRKAIETITQRNPNPYDSEPYYNLGLCLRYLENQDEAYEAFYKAIWSSTWKNSGYLSLAQIDMQRNDYELALEHANLSLNNNANNDKSYVIVAAAYRKMDQLHKAITTCNTALEKDHFNFGALFEKMKTRDLLGEKEAVDKLRNDLLILSRGYEQSFIEYALDYMAAGMFTEAIDILSFAFKDVSTYPMILYYAGWLHYQLNHKEDANRYFKEASIADPYLCFPNRLQDLNVLKLAIELNPEDAKAPYYLGNLFYDKCQYTESIKYWEMSVQIDATFPTVLRNLGIACFNKLKDPEKALFYYRKAFELDKSDPRILMELDQLYKRLTIEPGKRLRFLEENIATTIQRDDTYLQRLAIYNFEGDHEKALQFLADRHFHPWEGGEGKVSGQYVYALIHIARKKIKDKYFEKAIKLLEEVQTYPHNLGEGKLFGAQENETFYWLGYAYEGINQYQKAKEYFQKATLGLNEPSDAKYYNDQQPDQIFYKGLAWKKLGDKQKAADIFNNLISHGVKHIKDHLEIDYFAVSLPNLLIFEDDLDKRNKVYCLFLQGLGQLGLENYVHARNTFKEVLSMDNEHFGAKSHLKLAIEFTQ